MACRERDCALGKCVTPAGSWGGPSLCHPDAETGGSVGRESGSVEHMDLGCRSCWGGEGIPKGLFSAGEI